MRQAQQILLANVHTTHNKYIVDLFSKILGLGAGINNRARGDNTPSLIDLILCYDPAEIENLKYFSPLGKSDNCIILFDYITLCEKKSYKAEKKYYEKANYDAIKRHLAEINWKLLLNEKKCSITMEHI